MQEMLELAKDSIKTARDRVTTYANQKRSPRTLHVGQWVFLKIPKDSKTMRTGKHYKLSTRFCGPFIITEKIGTVAYTLALPSDVTVHPVFHVSRLKEKLGESDNIVPIEENVWEDIQTDYIPHEPEVVLDQRTRHSRRSAYDEYLIKWKGQSERFATWESVRALKAQFPHFIDEDINSP
ncbi:hypothetical protein L7F22_050019 [Adiantum nelumboides]|nr:hypothetical protein [Adiantum nelumboides]